MKKRKLKSMTKFLFFATLIWACSKETIYLTSSSKNQEIQLKEDLNSLAIELRANNKTFEDKEFVDETQKRFLIEKYGEAAYKESKSKSNLFFSSNGIENEMVVSENCSQFLNRLDSIYYNMENYDTMLLVISNIKIEIDQSTMNIQEKNRLKTTINAYNTIFEFIKDNPDLFGVDINNLAEAISASWWNSWGRCAFSIAGSVFVTATAVAVTVGTGGTAAGLGVWLASKAIATVAVIDGC